MADRRPGTVSDDGYGGGALARYGLGKQYLSELREHQG
jgi:hypothetical protein